MLGDCRSSLNVSTGVEPSCTDNSAVIAGGVGGVMTLSVSHHTHPSPDTEKDHQLPK